MTDLPWGQGGSDRDPRYLQQITGKGGRRRCTCGCGQRETHIGMANGVALMSGCELSVRRWVRNPRDSVRRRHAPVMNQRAWSTLWLAKLMLDSAGRFPSFDDVRRVVGLRSSAGAARIVNNLINAKLIERPEDKDGKPRITELGELALAEHDLP